MRPSLMMKTLFAILLASAIGFPLITRAQTKPAPQKFDPSKHIPPAGMMGGVPRRSASSAIKDSPTAPEPTPSANLNLNSRLLGDDAAVAPAPSSVATPAAPVVDPPPVTLDGLRSQLAQARTRYNGARLEYNQSIRVHDQTRALGARSRMRESSSTIASLKKQIARLTPKTHRALVKRKRHAQS